MYPYQMKIVNRDLKSNSCLQFCFPLYNYSKFKIRFLNFCHIRSFYNFASRVRVRIWNLLRRRFRYNFFELTMINDIAMQCPKLFLWIEAQVPVSSYIIKSNLSRPHFLKWFDNLSQFFLLFNQLLSYISSHFICHFF